MSSGAAGSGQRVVGDADATGETLLDIKGVTKRFEGLVALKDVSLSIRRGGIVEVIGPNGAGKTTLFHCITGFYRPDNGTTALDGERIDPLQRHEIAARGVSRTFQNIRLFNTMTAVENVLAGEHHTLKTGMWGRSFGRRRSAARSRRRRGGRAACSALSA